MRIPTGVAIALIVSGMWLLRGASADNTALEAIRKPGADSVISVFTVASAVVGVAMIYVAVLGSLRQQEPPK